MCKYCLQKYYTFQNSITFFLVVICRVHSEITQFLDGMEQVGYFTKALKKHLKH